MRPKGHPNEEHPVGDGCEHSPSCLRCTLARCKYDDRGEHRIWRDDAILKAHGREGLTVVELSRRFHISERTVSRILKGDGSRGR